VTSYPNPFEEALAPDPDAGLQMDVDLDVDPEPDNLAQKVTVGATWTAMANAASYGAQFISTIVLVRLLTPEDYGLTTVVWVVSSFAILFTDLGIGPAVVHRRHLDGDFVASAFWANLLTGVSLTLIVSALAPLIAWIYGEPDLIGLTILASLAFTLNSAVVPLALLERAFKFRLLAIVEALTRVAGWMAAIVFALIGFGASSLVAGPLLSFALLTLSLFVITRFRPRGFGSKDSYLSLWRYGRGVTGYGFTEFLMHQSDSILVPLVAPVSSVGLYNRAYNLMTLPVNQIGIPLARVMMPALSELQDDLERFRRGVRRSVLVVSAVGFPVAVGLGTTASTLIPLLFGDAWADSVFLVQILSIASIVLVAELPLRSIFTATGETSRLFRYGVVQCSLSIAAVLIGLFWGVHGVVIAIAVRQWLGIPISLGWPLKVVDQPMGEVLRLLLGPLLAVIGMGALVLGVGFAADGLADGVQFGLQALVGALSYVVLLRLFSPAAMHDLIGVVRRRRAS
jgi:O-antigen/teichoic acid export membrane protein